MLHGTTIEFSIRVYQRKKEEDLSTQFLKTQKGDQLIDLQDIALERYCNVLPVFGFSSAKYGNISIKSYVLYLLVNERGIEPIVFKKANQFVSFKFGDVQLLDLLFFHGVATSISSFLKTYKNSKTRNCIQYEWFDDPEKLSDIQLLPYENFFSKLRNINPLKINMRT